MKKCIKCGSHAFNLCAEGIDQGGFCDVHYWQGRAIRAEALAQPVQEPVAIYRAGQAEGEVFHVEFLKEMGDDEVLLYTTPPAQPAQEPVAWMHEWADGERIPLMHGRDICNNDDEPVSVRPLVFGDATPPAAHPAQKPQISTEELVYMTGVYDGKVFEREACAKVLESISNAPDMQSYAAAIRARRSNEPPTN